jgi:hypothetical protein
MTANEFRKLALALPATAEAAHMQHPDFRVGGKIFATLGPDETWGMVKLTPEEQAEFLAAQPAAFSPASGAWGRRGCTIVQLKSVKKSLMKEALQLAWQSTAPPKISDLVKSEPNVGRRLR